MNVYFLNYNHIQKSSWKHLMEVLKVSAIYCFDSIDRIPDEIVDSAPTDSFFTVSNNLLYTDSLQEMCNNIVYDIVNLCKERVFNQETGQYSYTSKDSFSNSIWYWPAYNIAKTDDPNFLVLGTYNTFNIQLNYGRTVISEISSHVHNLLKKQLSEDRYSKRICFYEYNTISNIEYIHRGYKSYNVRNMKWKQGYIVRKHSLHNYILRTLLQKYPDIYPITETEGRRKLSNYLSLEAINYDIDMINKYEQDYNDDDGSEWQREVDEMNAAFWAEMGESGSNCESWSGY